VLTLLAMGTAQGTISFLTQQPAQYFCGQKILQCDHQWLGATFHCRYRQPKGEKPQPSAFLFGRRISSLALSSIIPSFHKDQS